MVRSVSSAMVSTMSPPASARARRRNPPRAPGMVGMQPNVGEPAVQVEPDDVLDVLPPDQDPPPVAHLDVARDGPHRRVGERLHEPVDRVRLHHGVRVHHHHQVVAGQGDAGVQRGRLAARRHPGHPHVAEAQRLDHLGGTVDRGVIDHDHLDIAVRGQRQRAHGRTDSWRVRCTPTITDTASVTGGPTTRRSTGAAGRATPRTGQQQGYGPASALQQPAAAPTAGAECRPPPGSTTPAPHPPRLAGRCRRVTDPPAPRAAETVMNRYPRCFISGTNRSRAATVCARSPPASCINTIEPESPSGVAIRTIVGGAPDIRPTGAGPAGGFLSAIHRDHGQAVAAMTDGVDRSLRGAQRWAAEQVLRQHETSRCKQCTEANCPMLRWAEGVLGGGPAAYPTVEPVGHSL